MDKVTVACAQQKMRIYDDVETYRQDVYRFLRLSANKGARLVVFPELAGTMLAIPLMSGIGLGLLRAMEKGSDRKASWWDRTRGRLAAAAAKPFESNLRGNLERLLDKEPEALYSLYKEVFSRAAREWGMTVVAGSAYLANPTRGTRREEALVFGPDGSLLGRQAKVHLYAEDRGLAQAGTEVAVIDTPVARLGILLGTDVLYPEMGRLLALQGAEVLVTPAACPGWLLARKIRHALEARAQENQVFGLAAFLVGKNLIGQTRREDFAGRSAVLAPWEMTARGTGVLVELGTEHGEGIVAGELDFELLSQVQALSDTPVRRAMRMDVFGQHLPAFYQGPQTLQEAAQAAVAPAMAEAPALPEEPEPEEEAVLPEAPSPEAEEPEEARPAWPAEEAEEEAEEPWFVEEAAAETEEGGGWEPWEEAETLWPAEEEEPEEEPEEDEETL